MKIKTTIALLAVLGAIALTANAQDNTPPGDGPPTSDTQRPQRQDGGGGRGGFHLLPPRAAEMLKLTDDQKTQLAALEAETKAKLEKILTSAQMTKLKNMRPPMRPGGGQMRGGPDGLRQGNGPGAGDNSLPPGPPPGEGDGNTPPSGPPPGDK